MFQINLLVQLLLSYFFNAQGFLSIQNSALTEKLNYYNINSVN